jgi:hypothetical protein
VALVPPTIWRRTAGSIGNGAERNAGGFGFAEVAATTFVCSCMADSWGKWFTRITARGIPFQQRAQSNVTVNSYSLHLAKASPPEAIELDRVEAL